ncbi:NACHT domain-containing protein [Herbidospora sp. NEAU-GS84]|uniref:NACHT domain-containing protein n=1 Tax=Herbidospora solisilvae TaxID=2696284 RepID=A0A7C9J6L2_9ACTN|nr:NACHT domain-containing protein [Herbidospora solisilvae]NAS25805.1 NACHT domain-containing protein [Herbidospora solisilvae]
MTWATAPIVVGLVANLATGTVEVTAWWWAPLMWTLTVLLGAVTVVSQLRHSPVQLVDRAALITSAAAGLASKVRPQWEHEVALRRVRRQVPLRVWWSSTGRPIATAREFVLDEPGTTWQDMPLEGDVEGIVARFLELPHRQLVVIGAAGAGKSVLAILLTLGLIEHRATSEPVPVLLQIGGWNPEREHIAAFLARRLAGEYPHLAEPAGENRNLAQALIAERLVLAVLDGLDELPAEHRAAAVEMLHDYASAGNPLVVTCRIVEYENAVSASDTFLARAAVVEIEPVGVDQVIAFLSQSPPAPERWEPVFMHLRRHRDGPLASVLSTPLMVSLARTAYGTTAAQPADLLGHVDRDAIASILIGTYLTSVYETGRPTPPDGRKRRAYAPVQATRWLTCLAHHLHESYAPNLRWWHLPVELMAARPQRTRSLAALGITATGAAILGMTAGLLVGPLPGLAAAALAAVILTIARRDPFGEELFIPTSALDRELPPCQALTPRIAFTVGVGVGLVSVDLLAGIAGGAVAWLATRMMPLPIVARPREPTPEAAFRANHRTALIAALRYSPVNALTFAAAAFLLPGGPDPATTAACAMVAYGAAAAVLAGGWAWIWFRTAHLLLAVQGWLPLRLGVFLRDAHQRDVLRQTGTAWQFRHLLLQDHLARAPYDDLLRARAAHGDPGAVSQLAGVLADQGRTEAAITLLAAHAGDSNLAQQLTNLLAKDGRIDRIRAAADSGDRHASWHLARMLAAQGQMEELRARTDDGDPLAAQGLARVLAERGRIEEAVTVINSLPNSGEDHPAYGLAHVLAENGHMDAALAILRGRGNHREQADLLARHGRSDEAISLLRAHADSGDGHASRQLAELLAEQGKVQELRARAEQGDPHAARRLDRP